MTYQRRDRYGVCKRGRTGHWCCRVHRVSCMVARRLLDRGDAVLGLDNLNDYYDVRLKKRVWHGCRRTLLRSVAGCVGSARHAALFAQQRIRRVVHWQRKAVSAIRSRESPRVYRLATSTDF